MKITATALLIALGLTSPASASTRLRGNQPEETGRKLADSAPSQEIEGWPIDHQDFKSILLSDPKLSDLILEEEPGTLVNGTMLPASMAANFAKTILKGLVSGVSQKAGDNAMGWLLNAVGLDYGGQELDEIKDQLDEQKQMLSNIQSSLSALQNHLADAVNEITEAIDDAADRNDFTTWVATLNQNVGVIQGASDSLRVWSSLDPSSSYQADIQNFRHSILSDIPAAIRSIDGALMGSPFSEGMIPMFARLQWKVSSDIQDYISTFHDMMDYYYSYEVLGLQLMFEAYHTADPPNTGGCVNYYNIWKGFVSSQIDEYTRRSPYANKVHDFTDRYQTMGYPANVLTDNEHLFFLNFDGWVFKTTLDGQILGSDNAMVFIDNACLSYLVQDEANIYTIGCTSSAAEYVFARKYDKATFTNQGYVLLDRPRRFNNEKILAKGAEVDPVTNTLYVMQYIGSSNFNATIQAVDTNTMKYNKDATILIPGSSPAPGKMKVIDEDFLVYVSHEHSFELSVVDRASHAVVGVLKGSSASDYTHTGLLIETMWTDNRNNVQVSVTNSSGNIIEQFALGSNFRRVETQANGLVSYSNSGGYYISHQLGANYTLFDARKGALTMPITEFSNRVWAVAMTDELMVLSGWDNGVGRVISYNLSYPIEDLPVMEE